MGDRSVLRLSLGAFDAAPPPLAELGFHVRRTARDAYGFADAFFSTKGDVVFINHYQAHLFVERINEKRNVPEHERLRASELHAMGLVHELLHAMVGVWRSTVGAGVLSKLLGELAESFGDDLDHTLTTFVDHFPPPSVYRGRETVEEYLRGTTGGVSNREWALEEMILLWVSNQNPGYSQVEELVSDRELAERTTYLPIIRAIEGRLEREAPFGPFGENLLQLLLAPMRASPTSLSGQLEVMRSRWGAQLSGGTTFAKLLAGLDFIHEEGMWFLRKGHGHGGEDTTSVQTFTGELYEHEPERFSEDLDWMPRVVMIAKSTFVWLDQLSKKYSRPIHTLAEIPDEELATLASRGFTALWLIGLWRRSHASKQIKLLQGNHDATASAYSLHDYEIAPELGGEDAYQVLRSRAQRHGIRLASDMVPNHVGLDARWVIEHPERFVQSPHPPFPGYRFTGPELSTDPRVSIKIEDGYWQRTDAAVVFQRVDRHTGETRYIYHGNDGTTMPWNDTAQLDYLRADVREAVIQTILHVARKFPIIRFDAAMTLAKKHYQRLWFPLPGTGGAIPSRAEHAMTRERFDELFPAEFWREVVDRVAVEVPNTLLLAEAFWLMEGYFVRTLGMHRVYNSAFMNMLKREDNAGFRASIRNVLEFNPQILKRHVNFMNNPDEEPAIAQFGRDDKYFGVCVLLSTMPGLPMFGHGQVEGLHEKYGMEYVRAKWDERPDEHLVDRHAREIFPLLKKRYLFADVEQFFMYDLVRDDGSVDEDVFAYSNRFGGERALVVYHNKFKDTRGVLRASVGYLGPSGEIVQRSFVDGLALTRGVGRYLVYRSAVTGLEHLRSLERIFERGFELELR
ncbi:alpha-amylase, partial [Myxococcota bacterium]|nr:alpha-amylase [Myxococcota bacterium]